MTFLTRIVGVLKRPPPRPDRPARKYAAWADGLETRDGSQRVEVLHARRAGGRPGARRAVAAAGGRSVEGTPK